MYPSLDKIEVALREGSKGNMEGVKTQLSSAPIDLPLFTISSHELHEVARKLIQSDGDKRFFDRVFEEILKIHKEEEKEEEVRGGLRGG